jgi:guanidinobutyrase
MHTDTGHPFTPPLFAPLGGNEMPRFSGIATMMRLPLVTDPGQLDVGFVGVGLDLGTSNRSGTRFGPRQIRSESVLLRPYNMATRAAPFDTLRVADLGDIAINPYNLADSVVRIEQGFDRIVNAGCTPITLGGDHTITLPILRALHRRHGPVGLIHIDAHADVNDTMNGEKIAHGTTFRRALEEGLLDPHRVVQIGLRGTGYTAEDFDWCRKQGFRVVQVEECWGRSLAPLMDTVRQQLGTGPVYFSLDIDGIDPAFAPGTGTPEIAGLTVPQTLEVIRGAWGLQIIGADVVEVSPPYDPNGTTALLGANLAYELLCVLPGVVRRPVAPSTL